MLQRTHKIKSSTLLPAFWPQEGTIQALNPTLGHGPHSRSHISTTYVGGGAYLQPEASPGPTGLHHKFHSRQSCKCPPDSWTLAIKGTTAASPVYNLCLTMWVGCTSSVLGTRKGGKTGPAREAENFQSKTEHFGTPSPTPPRFSLCLRTSEDAEPPFGCCIGLSLAQMKIASLWLSPQDH